MNKIKIIALFGKSASGKDSIQKWIIKSFPSATHSIISCTTRPKRDYEEDKKDYFFLTNEEFANKVLDGSMLEATEFNNWFYGTPIEALDKDKINIGVFNPAGVRQLLDRPDCEVTVYWVTASDKQRLYRQLDREENPDVKEIIRRFSADEEDFTDIDFDYTEVINETFDDFYANAEQIAGQIEDMLAQGRH